MRAPVYCKIDVPRGAISPEEGSRFLLTGMDAWFTAIQLRLRDDLPMTNVSPSPADCLAVVLAAGEGTRMKSARPKVLHAVAGRSMLAHVLAGVMEAGADRVAVVVGPDRADVSAEALRLAPKAQVFEQRERLGTAHAALRARQALAAGCGELLVVFADTPLIPVSYTHLTLPTICSV